MSDLLAELQAAGQVEARGGFSIDPEKAREKLRQYQLADPHRYILLLVEAAISAGATKLEFEVDSDDMHLRFDGVVFAREQLENIYGSLFADREDTTELELEDLARLRGLQQLAFALNSAMALNPRFARVTSVDAGGRGTVLVLHPSDPDQIEAVEGQTPGTHVHVKDRFRPGLLLEFFRMIDDQLSEAVLLRRHCRWSRIPVHLNGTQISGPIVFEDEVWGSVEVVDEGQVIGRAGLGQREPKPEPRLGPEPPRPLAPAAAHLLSNGVYFETRIMNARGVPGLVVVVDSPRFGKDVSQTKLVHDASYDAVLDAVVAAQDKLILALAELGPRDPAPDWRAEVLREWLWRRAPIPTHARRLRQLLDDDPVFAAVCEVPMWPVIGAEPVPTRALVLERQPIRHASRDFEFAPVDVPFVLHDPAGPAWALLERLFGDRLEDYTAAMQREAERQQRRLEFMTRRQLPELGEGFYLIRERVDEGVIPVGRQHGTIRGELGLRALGHRDSWIRLVSEGCLLQELSLDGPVPGLHVVVAAELEPGPDYLSARPTPALAAAAVAILDALGRAMSALARTSDHRNQSAELRQILRSFVQQAWRRDYAIGFLQQLGFTRREARRELEGLGVELRPAIQVEPEQLRDPEARHPFVDVPLFARVGGRPVSLADLGGWRAAGQRLAWLEPWPGDLPEIDCEVLILDREDRELLRELFGNEALEPFAERLAGLRRRAQFMTRPQVELGHRGPILAEVALVGEGVRGSLAMREYAFTAAAEGRTPIEVYYCERELDVVELELPLPGLVAWVESESFTPDVTFETLARPVELRPLLLAGLGELVVRQLERARAGAPLLRCEWWSLMMVSNVVLGEGALTRALLTLREELGFEAAIVELAGLVELLARYPERDLDRAMAWLRGRGQGPSAAAVQDRLRRPTRNLSAAERELQGLRQALVPHLAELLTLPLLRRFHGRGPSGTRELSFDALLGQVSRGEPIAWVGEDFGLESVPKLDFEIVVLDPIEHDLVKRLIGDTGLELVSDWLVGRAKFERRRKITEVRIPRGSTLVRLAIDEPGVRGELGVARQSGGDFQRTKIRVFTEGREVTVVDVPTRQLAFVGALEFDDLELNAAHDDISDASRDRIRAFVDERHEPLLNALADNFEKRGRVEGGELAGLVRHLLRTWPPQNGGYEARARKQPGIFRRLAELPVFSGARKPWSAVELAALREHGRIATLAYRRPSAELPDQPVVILDGDDVEDTLRALFGKIYDLDEELERRREIEARKQAAPVMPKAAPGAAVAQVEISGEGLEGALWLQGDRCEVMFGQDGKVVETRVISSLCWCAGAVTGPGLGVARDWSRVVLSRAQERLLEREACALWDGLADDFVRRSEVAGPRNGKEREVLANLRNGLHGLFMRLHAQFGNLQRKRKRSKRGGKPSGRGSRYERLYAKTWVLPVLQLASGRWISPNTAERERPLELAELGLWVGPSAEELEHARAVKRREAERAQERERDAAQERERERRRTEAEARAREAERRREADARARREAKRQAEQEREQQRAKASAPAKAAEPQVEAKVKAKPAPSAEELLLEAVREELRLVRADNTGLVSNRILDSIVLGQAVRRGPLLRHGEGQVEFDVGHPLFVAALDSYLDDPGVLTLLASSAYTYLNTIHLEIEDDHEAEFLRLHAGYAATSFEDG